MEQNSIDAVFENGSFRPVVPLPIPMVEGKRVRLRIEEAKPNTTLELACAIYDGLSAEEIAEVERIALDRNAFFTSRASAN